MNAPARPEPGRREPPLFMWSLYERPVDFPEHIVARQWAVFSSLAVSAPIACLFDSVPAARREMMLAGRTNIGREAFDDAAIIETWI